MNIARTANASGQITSKWPIIEPLRRGELMQALAEIGLDEAFASINAEQQRKIYLTIRVTLQHRSA